jgi:nitroreductase
MMTPDAFFDLVRQNRSCRRFDHSYKIDDPTLEHLVNLARHCASAANMQPLKYVLCNDDAKNKEIYDCLGWAAYLTKWKGPEENERPAAYIVIAGDTRIANNFWCDHGIAAQTMLLGARSMGLAGCMFGAINIKKLKSSLNMADHLEVKLVVALGKPVEEVQIDDLDEDGSIKYWRDDNNVHHVPKRSVTDLIAGKW